ncbi:hypothetical protein F4801DRAFT_552128 [Xylaria longipes]|nr:hypothetical protein F4801DRAFT_552128 [Xylaria longipes]
MIISFFKRVFARAAMICAPCVVVAAGTLEHSESIFTIIRAVYEDFGDYLHSGLIARSSRVDIRHTTTLTVSYCYREASLSHGLSSGRKFVLR